MAVRLRPYSTTTRRLTCCLATVARSAYSPGASPRSNSGQAALPLLAQLRAARISSELYPDASKLQKQFVYADAKGIPLVIIMGSGEVAAGVVKIKIMRTGVDWVLPVGEVVAALTLA